jgi:molybdopterin converting factor small subunit
MHVEFLGIARERAGVAEVELHAHTFGQLVSILAVRFPALEELLSPDARRPSVVANINGERFVTDPDTPLAPDDCVLILSADAGG